MQAWDTNVRTCTMAAVLYIYVVFTTASVLSTDWPFLSQKIHMCVHTYVHTINVFHHIHKWNVLLWGRRWWLHRLRRRGLCDRRRGTASWLWHCGLHWCGGGRLSAGSFEGTHFEANGKAIDIPTRPGMHMLRQGYTHKWICTHKRTPYKHAHRKT